MEKPKAYYRNVLQATNFESFFSFWFSASESRAPWKQFWETAAWTKCKHHANREVVLTPLQECWVTYAHNRQRVKPGKPTFPISQWPKTGGGFCNFTSGIKIQTFFAPHSSFTLLHWYCSGKTVFNFFYQSYMTKCYENRKNNIAGWVQTLDQW